MSPRISTTPDCLKSFWCRVLSAITVRVLTTFHNSPWKSERNSKGESVPGAMTDELIVFGCFECLEEAGATVDFFSGETNVGDCLDENGRGADESESELMVYDLSEELSQILFLGTEGIFIEDLRPLRRATTDHSGHWSLVDFHLGWEGEGFFDGVS